MKILIFGASGLTGIELVNQALSLGYEVSAFVRDPRKLQIDHPRLMKVTGDATKPDTVARAVPGHDAVICVLGASTPFKHDFSLINGVKNIIDVMQASNVKRFVYLSFLGVRENRKELGFIINNVMAFFLRNVIADHEEKENLIRKSNLRWTLVRPPKLTNGKHRGVFRSGERILPASLIAAISRADVADFMLQQVTSDEYLYKAPRVLY